ncbi:MAG: hypothetical protein RhofKO_43330 [Rhodothermales bacterium]
MDKTPERAEVLEALPDAHVRVRMESGEEVVAAMAMNLRLRYIQLKPNDRVLVERDGEAAKIVGQDL